MPRRYEGIQHIIDVIPANQSKSVIHNAPMLDRIFKGFDESGSEMIPTTNTYRLGWDSAITFNVNAGQFANLSICTVTPTSYSNYRTENPGVSVDQIVTRGVSSCSVVHLYEGNDHILAHVQTTKSAVAFALLSAFAAGRNNVWLEGSFYRNDRAEKLLTDLAALPNVTVKNVMGRGVVGLTQGDACLIHSEIGVAAVGQNGTTFFGDCNIVDNGILVNNAYGLVNGNQLDLFEW